MTTTWRKSTYSGANGSCVELGPGHGNAVGMRDTKLGADSPVLTFDRDAVAALVAAIKTGA